MYKYTRVQWRLLSGKIRCWYGVYRWW